MTSPRLDDAARSSVRDGNDLLSAAGFCDVEALRHGGGATIYRATQPALARTVAVHLQHEPIGDTRERQRFAEQCAVLGHLGDHPNILEVYGCDFGGQGRPYLVTELPTGDTLADRLQPAGWEWRGVMEMAVALAGALETAHQAGVVHGHVTAENVLLSAYGRPQLDFAAAAVDAGDAERAHDVRDLAAVCAAAFAGGDGVPEELRRLLTEAQSGRFSTALQLGTAVQQLQEELACAVTPLPVAAPDPAAPGSTPAAPGTRRRRQRLEQRHSRRSVTALAGAGLLLCAAVAIAILRAATPAPPLLDVRRLGGAWQPDLALVEQLRAAPDAYLCRDPAADAEGPAPQVEAYTTATPGARVALLLQTLPPPAATVLLDDVATQAECLEQLEGLSGGRVDRVDVGDDAVLLRYRRAGAAAPVEIRVVVARRGEVVGRAVHLGYPTGDPAVTAVLQQALDEALARPAR